MIPENGKMCRKSTGPTDRSTWWMAGELQATSGCWVNAGLISANMADIGPVFTIGELSEIFVIL